MKRFILKLIRKLSRVIDIIASPFVYLAAKFLKIVRQLGMYNKFPITRKILLHVGVYPLIDHYYEPIFDTRHLRHSLRDDRRLPGINMNDAGQLELLNSFHYQEELLKFPVDKPDDFDSDRKYYYNCGSYESGDGEFLYNMVRRFRPSHIIEVGSGFSTLMIINALRKNQQEDNHYQYLHECIEPYEMTWLETQPVKVIRQRLEEVEKSLFVNLKADDMLIIDSSHMIRPQGDVVTEYLEILPTLAPGVIVHVHDIFMPKDYLDNWLYKEFHFWNEQHLLEAFLTCNKEFEILGAVNYLTHHYYNQLADKCPILKQQPGREPGAFWIRRL